MRQIQATQQPASMHQKGVPWPSAYLSKSFLLLPCWGLFQREASGTYFPALGGVFFRQSPRNLGCCFRRRFATSSPAADASRLRTCPSPPLKVKLMSAPRQIFPPELAGIPMRKGSLPTVQTFRHCYLIQKGAFKLPNLEALANADLCWVFLQGLDQHELLTVETMGFEPVVRSLTQNLGEGLYQAKKVRISRFSFCRYLPVDPSNTRL